MELTIKSVEDQDIAIAPPVGDDADPMDILTLIYCWIWDSGSGVDLASLSALGSIERTPARPIHFNTAGGKTTGSEVVALNISAFGNSKVFPYLLQSTPGVLSVGDRVLNHWFNSSWLNGECLCLILPEPDPKVVPLDVINQIPYLVRGGVHTKWFVTKIEYETGVKIRKGRLLCQSKFTIPTKDAVPSAGLEGDASGDEVEVEGDEEDGDKADTEDVSTDAYFEDISEADEDWDKPVWRHLRKHDALFGVRDLSKVAKSLKHLATYKPALPNHGEVCARAKTKQKYRFKGRSLREPKKWGYNTTLDTIYMRDWYKRPSGGNDPDIINVYGVFTKMKLCEPISSLDTLDMHDSIEFYIGSDKEAIDRTYCENIKSLKKPIYNLGIVKRREPAWYPS